MCPLRFILVFLSAAVAGFFVLKNLSSDPDNLVQDSASVRQQYQSASSSSSLSSKVVSATRSGFWTFVDMASGRYLWRTLMSSSTA